jgi:RNA polymerase sigma-70 factor (ECF subfamily)
MTARHPRVRPGWQEERSLLSQLKKKDARALDRFVHEHGTKLYRLAFRLSGDEELALQILTTALTTAFKRTAFRAEEEELGAWLVGFVLRQAMARGGKARKTSPPAATVDWSPLLENEDSRHKLRLRLQEEARRLPADLRGAWVLMDAEGRDAVEAAAVLELTPATAASRLHRARLCLRDTLSVPAPGVPER